LQKESRIFLFDYLKFFAFLCVFSVHFSQMFPHMNGIIHSVFMYGQSGCQLFLLITGYFIADSVKKDGFSYPTFIRKKIFSVAPGYIVAIALYFLLNSVLVRLDIQPAFEGVYNIRSILVNAFLLNGFVPQYNNNVVPGGWYVGTLVIAFFVLPPLYKFFKGKKKSAKALAILFSVFLSVAFAKICCMVDNSLVGNNSFSYYFIFTQLPVLLMGMFLNEFKTKKIKPAFCACAFFLFTLVSLIILKTKNYLLVSLAPAFIGLSFVFLVLLLRKYDLMQKKENLMIFIGQRTYGCYLTHFIFAWYVPKIIRNIIEASDNLLFAVLLIPCFALSVCTGILFSSLITWRKKK